MIHAMGNGSMTLLSGDGVSSMHAEEPLKRLVVIGSSAGGIDALSTLVKQLPADLPAPILIAQHLSPDRPSYLQQILSKHSPLPVRVLAEHQPQPLEPGVVLVVPANRHVEVTQSEVRLITDSAGRPKPSIDLLFGSAAEIYGEGLVAVILTGMGADGAAGARWVKEYGGAVVIQEPTTASFPAMPLALAPTTVDVVAELHEIGPLLQRLLTEVPVQPGADEALLQTLLEQIRRQSGIDFSSYKAATIQRRLQHRVVATRSDGLAAYSRYLRKNPDEYQRLVNTFLIKVTDFFRDTELFDHLRQVVLPELLAAVKKGDELRIWSAGCATGEEAYSLAMMVSELLDDRDQPIDVRIFATDVDAGAVGFARRGLYPAAAVANLPSETIERHFVEETSGAFEVKKSIRSLVVFGQHDLGQRSPFPRIDLALCRNVLIYFTPELQKRALQLFAFSVRDQGYLVLGKSETTTPLPDYFALDQPRLRIYRRYGDRVLIPAARVGPTALPIRQPVISGLQADASRLPRALTPRLPAERAADILLRLPVGVVVVDRQYDIQSINNAARTLLGIHSAAIGEDLVHKVQNASLTSLRAAIDAAFRGETPSGIYPVATTETVMGEARHLSITCYSERPGSAAVSSVVVLISDVTEAEQRRADVEQEAKGRDHELGHAQEQMLRLQDTNRALVDANQDLSFTNDELRSANEEFLIGNEEVQAATEEDETLNEELQATNEELETLNEELQATVEELNTTNDDLQARTSELQDLATQREVERQNTERERAKLRAILGSMSDAVLVVDPAGKPLLTNNAYDLLFGERGDIGAEDDNGVALADADRPFTRARRVETFNMQFSQADATGTWRWFEANGQPVRADGDRASGMVVVRDITERSLRRLQDQFLAMVSHELRTPLTALIGALQLLQRQRKPFDQTVVTGYVDRAVAQARRLSSHVDDLVDVVRLRSETMAFRREPVELRAVIEQAVDVAVLVGDGSPIEIDADPESVNVIGDGRRLEQAVVNLLTNAIVYAPGGERIIVRLRCDPAAQLATIEVEDAGPGISPADLPHVFSRFFRITEGQHTRPEGLGLGLFIVREIAQAHGGSVSVVSPPGRGAMFTIQIPLSSAVTSDLEPRT